MQPFCREFLAHLQELHDEIKTIIEGLPQNALDWKPGKDFNSLGVLIVHISGAERYWLGDVVAHLPSERDREAEFQARNINRDALTALLQESREFTRSVLEGLTFQDLETSRISPRNNRKVTVGWALNHILKHTALHVGHIQIARQLWEQNQKVKQIQQ